MTGMSEAGISLARSVERTALRKLIPLANKAPDPRSSSYRAERSAELRIFDVDARFESAGTWAGVEQLAEMAYHGLLNVGQDAIIEEHRLELHLVLLNYRGRIHPKYPCLTDTATANEKTRFYALDRAYRLVHGLVDMILQWKCALHDGTRWVVLVRNFDQAQHLGTRFFVELARRSTSAGEIDVVIETRQEGSDLARRLPGVRAVPVPPWVAEFWPHAAAPQLISEAEAAMLEAQLSDVPDTLLEQKYPPLLARYRSSGNRLAAARLALKIFMIYNSLGYYHEARYLMDLALPYFDQLVGKDEVRRIHYVSKLNICLVQTDDVAGALRVVQDLAASYLTMPHVVANMNYILGMHYLRYAQVKDLERAEQHILRAVETVRAVKDSPEAHEYPFQKVFIDNGLAFLRARQARHQEALELCKAGYDFLTREMGEDRHLLHRSVLQYNIAQVYVMLGRLEEGLEHYRNAIRMDPNYSEYHNEIGNILQDQERLSGGHRTLQAGHQVQRSLSRGVFQ